MYFIFVLAIVYVYIIMLTELILNFSTFALFFFRCHGSVANVLRHATPVRVQLPRLQSRHATYAAGHLRRSGGCCDGGSGRADGGGRGKRPIGETTILHDGRIGIDGDRDRYGVGGTVRCRDDRDRFGTTATRGQTAQTRDRAESGHRHRQRARRPVVQSGSA